MEARAKASHTMIVFRIAAIFAIGLTVMSFKTKNFDFKPMGINPDMFCIDDIAHDITASMNIVVRQYENFGKFMILMSSLMIDAMAIYSMTVFIMTSNTARLTYCIAIFYGVRALIQVLFYIKIGELSFQNTGRIALACAFHTVDDGTVRHHMRLLLQRTHWLYSLEHHGTDIRGKKQGKDDVDGLVSVLCDDHPDGV